METVQKELFDWLCNEFRFVGGQNAFQNRVPTTNQLGDQPIMWLVQSSGFVVRQFHSHSKLKEYVFLLNYRNVKAQAVEREILEMEQVINHVKCFDLPSYKVIQIQSDSFGTDVDPDAEKFTRGSLSITLQVLDNYEEERGDEST